MSSPGNDSLLFSFFLFSALVCYSFLLYTAFLVFNFYSLVCNACCSILSALLFHCENERKRRIVIVIVITLLIILALLHCIHFLRQRESVRLGGRLLAWKESWEFRFSECETGVCLRNQFTSLGFKLRELIRKEIYVLCLSLFWFLIFWKRVQVDYKVVSCVGDRPERCVV